MSRCYDYAVLGGGPAGVAVAVKLAGWGYRIAVLQRPRSYRALEGLSERALQGLRFLGLRHTLAQVGRRAERRARWNGKLFAGNGDWLVEREDFDRALLADADTAGIQVIEGGGRAEPAPHGWRLTFAGGSIDADWLIDARGRAAPAAGGLNGPLTTALSQRWRFTGGQPWTEVVPFADGWAWLAATQDGSAVVQLFVDGEKLPPRGRLAAYFQNLIDNAAELRQALANGRPLGPVIARYAQPRLASRLFDAEQRRALLGDAATAPDPLSGHGLFGAIGGALALSAGLHTLTRDANAVAAVQQFYNEKVSSDFWRMARSGRDFYRQERRWPERPFWRRRVVWPDNEPTHPPVSGPVVVAPRPVNDNGTIVIREVVISADQPRGVWQVAGVRLAPLLHRLRQGPALSAERYAVEHCLDPRACRAALAWLRQRGELGGRALDISHPTAARPDG